MFEFLSNDEIAKIVIPYYRINQPEAAANEIVKCAYRKWRQVSLHAFQLNPDYRKKKLWTT